MLVMRHNNWFSFVLFLLVLLILIGFVVLHVVGVSFITLFVFSDVCEPRGS